MNQDLILKAMTRAEAMEEVDFAAALAQAIRDQYGSKANDPAFLLELLTLELTGEFRRRFRKSVMDPDEVIEAEQTSLFPVAHWVVVQTDDGGEIFKAGRSATAIEHRDHIVRVTRNQKARTRKLEQACNKIVALTAEVTKNGDDPTQLLYVDAIDKYGRAAIEAIREPE